MAVRELNKVLNWLGVRVFAAMGSPKVQGIQADRERYFVCAALCVCVCLSPAFWWFVLTSPASQPGTCRVAESPVRFARVTRLLVCFFWKW